MKVFLDDIRFPRDCTSYMKHRIQEEATIYNRDGWKIVRDYHDFVTYVTENIDDITHVSFDHDLASEHYTALMTTDGEADYDVLSLMFKEKTGYDCAVFLKQLCNEKGISYPRIYIHTMNPIGFLKIRNLFRIK